MATLIKSDGALSQVFPANGKKFTLEELQRRHGDCVAVNAVVAVCGIVLAILTAIILRKR